jgi:hypothetical protein
MTFSGSPFSMKRVIFIEGMDYSCDGKEKEDEADTFAEERLRSVKGLFYSRG